MSLTSKFLLNRSGVGIAEAMEPVDLPLMLGYCKAQKHIGKLTFLSLSELQSPKVGLSVRGVGLRRIDGILNTHEQLVKYVD
jgi:hypothetical protein